MSVMSPHTLFIDGLELQTFPTWQAAAQEIVATGYAHWDGNWLVRHEGVELLDAFQISARELGDVLG